MISNWIFSMYADAPTVFLFAGRIGLAVAIIVTLWVVIVDIRYYEPVGSTFFDGAVAFLGTWVATFLAWLSVPMIVGGMLWLVFL